MNRNSLLSDPSKYMVAAGRAGEPELGFFEGAGVLFSDVSGAGAGAMKVIGSSSSYPIIEKM